MSYSAGMAAWKVAFQLSPIILVNGLVGDFPGSILPIIAITEAVNFPLGVLSSGGDVNLENFFANFRPLPGGTLLDQDLGRYPFANQAIAANAVIAQPQTISMEMVCPARGNFGYLAKLPIMIMLREALYQHNNSGGTYHVATPSFIYTNCIMRSFRDTSNASTAQPQNTWQLDFERPLVTLDQAQAAQSSLMNWLTRQTKFNGPPTWSGLSSAVGQPGSLVGPSLIPAASGGPASSTIGVGPTAFT
jgi:hypothetical protein